MKVLLTELQDIEDRITAREAEGCTHQEAELKGVEEYIECSILKWLFLKMFKTVLMKVSNLWRNGILRGYPMESAWRDARIARIYEGTNEINRMLSVGMLIKKAMKGHVDLLGPATKVGEELIGIPLLKLLIILNYLQKKKKWSVN
jgi:hypothetical protein